ncbi:MAG: hypothetical protein Q8K49_12360 [Brevundimonas sp.]|nr:hypothetical protein [Brevundimonas sp.]
MIAPAAAPEDQTSSAVAVAGDLVLGAATGYGVADIAPFVRSLRAVYQGGAALVVDEASALTSFLEAHDIKAVPATSSPAWSPHPVMTRFAAFDRILAQRPGPGSVLITDVRDVVFQSSPFDPAPGVLELFVEFEGGRLGDHAFNRKHLRALVGDDLAATMAHRPCLCVGTVMGSRAGVSRFCRTILMLAAIPRSHIGGAFGADQAACNLAAHLGLVEHEVRANYGRVATVGLTPSDTLTVSEGVILNPDGSASAIVHQYDRHPHLMDAVHGLWGAGLERRERVRPTTFDDRAKKLRNSMLRRLPELR